MSKAQALKQLDDLLTKHRLTSKERIAIKKRVTPLVGVLDWAALLELIMFFISLFKKT